MSIDIYVSGLYPDEKHSGMFNIIYDITINGILYKCKRTGLGICSGADVSCNGKYGDFITVMFEIVNIEQNQEVLIAKFNNGKWEYFNT